jgi:hypothetical protein
VSRVLLQHSQKLSRCILSQLFLRIRERVWQPYTFEFLHSYLVLQYFIHCRNASFEVSRHNIQRNEWIFIEELSANGFQERQRFSRARFAFARIIPFLKQHSYLLAIMTFKALRPIVFNNSLWMSLLQSIFIQRNFTITHWYFCPSTDSLILRLSCQTR